MSRKMERAVLKQEDPPLEIGGPSPLASAFAEERHLKRTSKLGNSLPVWKPGDGRIDSERHTLPPRPPPATPLLFVLAKRTLSPPQPCVICQSACRLSVVFANAPMLPL